MSSRPSRARVSSTTCAARACSRTSARKDTTRPPAAFNKFSAAAIEASAAASSTARSAPPRASSSAHARPMPDAAPVTSATLPSNSNVTTVPPPSSDSPRLACLREGRAEPRLVDAPLLLAGVGEGDDAVGGGGAPPEPDVEGAQLVAAEDRERHLIAGALLGQPRVEEVARQTPRLGRGGGVARR